MKIQEAIAGRSAALDLLIAELRNLSIAQGSLASAARINQALGGMSATIELLKSNIGPSPKFEDMILEEIVEIKKRLEEIENARP